MFGEKLDYLLLRRLAHDRNMATEAELDARARQERASSDDAADRLHVHLERFGGWFPIDPRLSYLDMGCGNGELTLGLANLGCENVTGVDFVPRNIAACESAARRMGVGDGVRFLAADLNTWVPPQRYDVLVSFDAFEHIQDPRRFLARMSDFVAPDGVAVLGFGPLFHSPFGDHMSDFFRVQVPWRGVLFSEKAVMRVRREFFRPSDAAEHYEDIVGGLNLMRFSDFLTYARETGWDFAFLAPNPRLKRLPALHAVSEVLTRIPVIRDYFVFSVYAILRRSPAAPDRP